MNNNPFIQLEHVTVSFNKNEALNDINLRIYENDFFCLLGPSGCGKSTIIKLIGGFLKPSKGKVRFKNNEIEEPSIERGIVFQNQTLFPWYNVRDNILYSLKQKNIPKDEYDSTLDMLLEAVDLKGFSERKVFNLSGGQQQRVALARALAAKPKVILMDEPFGALDSFTRTKMQKMIKKIATNNDLTIVFVTHDIDEAMILGNRILLMNDDHQVVNIFENSIDMYPNKETLKKTILEQLNQ